ncbi:MAG: hypothetical protein ACKVHE_30525 [Planctomycetales bacterium]|jgi:hypothetical protein
MSSIEDEFNKVSHLVPPLQISLNDRAWCSLNRLTDWCAELADTDSAASFSMNRLIGDYAFHAAATGTTSGPTLWKSSANGCTSTEGGSHRDAFQRLFHEANWSPAVAMLPITMLDSWFAGRTRSKVIGPGIGTPLKEALFAELNEYCRCYCLASFG